MNKINRHAVLCMIALGMTLPLTAVATNGYFAHGYGTKNKGLAGGGVALPQDAMAAATNPAGMVFVGERLDIGAAYFSPSPRSYESTGGPSNACAGPGQCSFSIGPQTIESENDGFIIPSFAMNWALGANRSAGITVYGNGGMNTEYKGGTASFDPTGTGTGFISSPGTYGAGTAGVNLEQLFMNGSYAVKFANGTAAGISALFAYQRFEATGLDSFAPRSLDPSNLSNNGVDTSTGIGLKWGMQSEVGPGFTFAASYQTRIDMSEFDKYSGLFAEDGDFDIPATLTAGFALKTGKSSTVTADFQRIYYSDVKAIANPISRFTDGSCVAGATNGTGNGCLGGSNGAGFGWRDVNVMKLGYQHVLSSAMTLRVGYSKGSQPIPDSEVLFNILAPAMIEEHFTAGLTRILSGSSEFNFTAMYAKGDPVNGTSTFDGAQTITLDMEQFELEASYSKKF